MVFQRFCSSSISNWTESPQEILFHALVNAAITHSNNRRKLTVQALKMYFKKLSAGLFFC